MKQDILHFDKKIKKPEHLLRHYALCRCVDCRKFYEEDYTTCTFINTCQMPPLNECIRGMCLKHHNLECNDDL